jgi:hypothetical protein
MSARQPASPPAGTIEAVSADETHGPGKRNRLSILLVEGQGVEGDAQTAPRSSTSPAPSTAAGSRTCARST